MMTSMFDNVNKKLAELQREAYQLNDQSPYEPRRFKTSKDGKKLLLDPCDDFERNWYEKDDEFGDI